MVELSPETVAGFFGGAANIISVSSRSASEGDLSVNEKIKSASIQNGLLVVLPVEEEHVGIFRENRVHVQTNVRVSLTSGGVSML